MKTHQTVESRESRVESFVPRRAFTLLELLAVISIIAVLAAFLLAGAGAFNKRQKINRTQAEMAKLELALDNYKAAYGFYPPSNPNNFLVSQLYYELLGTTNNNGTYQTLDGSATINAADVPAAFNAGGFVNCSKPGAGEDAVAARNFLPGLPPNQIYRPYTNAPSTVGVTLIIGSVGGPDATYRPLDTNAPDLNPWRYNSVNPTNNPGAYDLWIQLSIGGKTNLICNWSKQVQINRPLP